MSDADFLRGFAGTDGAPPTARQLYQAFTLLGFDFGYGEMREGALEYLAEYTQRWGRPSPENLLAIARRFAPGQLRPDPEVEVEDDEMAGHPTAEEIELLGPFTSEEMDTQLALATLGAVRHADGPDVLAPFLASPYAIERWIAGIGLVAMHDELVLPSVERMLVKFVGPDQPQTSQSGGIENFRLMRRRLLRLLPQWGDPRVAPLIRAGLIATVRAEEIEVPEPGQSTGLEAWRRFANQQMFWAEEEHPYVYALGRIGAFGALEGVPTRSGIYSRQDSWIRDGKGGLRHGSGVSDSHADGFRANIWRVLMCFGALDSRFRGKIGTIHDFADMPELAEAVELLLAGKFGMDEAARRQAMKDFDQASWVSWTMFDYSWERDRARMIDEIEGED